MSYNRESIDELRSMIAAYRAEIRDPDTHPDDVGDKQHELELMKRSLVNRVKIRKHGGDDSLSWAVFIEGRVKWTGLSLAEARHYRRIEQKELIK